MQSSIFEVMLPNSLGIPKVIGDAIQNTVRIKRHFENGQK
jgi:hypothetical protein